MWRFALGLMLVLTSPESFAAEVSDVETDSAVRQVVQTRRGAYVETKGGTFRLRECNGAGICFKRDVIRGLPPRAPAEGLPDGAVALASAGDIRRAWYAGPTRRYGHGVLGDAVEAAGLTAELASGKTIRLVLPQTHVFEDLTPRIADLDADGMNEIVCIRSSLTGGAAVAVYGIAGGKLVLKAQSPEIGRANRWLNIAGIADYAGRGRPVIAWVETPHIGGRLKMAVFDGNELKPVAKTRDGFSNHVIGSRELQLSASHDFSGDGVPELVLPSADRRKIMIVGRAGVRSIAVPGRISHRIIVVGGTVLTATDDGRLISIVP